MQLKHHCHRSCRHQTTSCQQPWAKHVRNSTLYAALPTVILFISVLRGRLKVPTAPESFSFPHNSTGAKLPPSDANQISWDLIVKLSEWVRDGRNSQTTTTTTPPPTLTRSHNAPPARLYINQSAAYRHNTGPSGNRIQSVRECGGNLSIINRQYNNTYSQPITCDSHVVTQQMSLTN